jgi:hypothetical protein
LGKEPAEDLGPILDALEPVLDDGGELVDGTGGEVASRFMFDHAPSTGLMPGAQARSRSTVSHSGASMKLCIVALMWLFRLSQIIMTGARRSGPRTTRT